MQRRLEIGKQFNVFALPVQNRPNRRIRQRRIFHDITLGRRRGCHGAEALREFADVNSGAGNRQQAHRRQDGKSAADIIRNDVGFVAFTVS